MDYGIDGVVTWVVDQAQGLFTIGFIIVIAIVIFKRSIGGLITTIIIGSIIAMFIFFPDTIENLGGGLRNLISGGE